MLNLAFSSLQGVKNLRISIGDESIGANHVSRVGWSVDGGNYQLGEYKHSWGYGGTAKFSTDRQFTDFNVKFYNNDVVTCYLVSWNVIYKGLTGFVLWRETWFN